MTRDLGLRRLESIHRQLRAEVRLLLGDPAGAADDLRAAREIFEENGDRWFLSGVVVDLVRAVRAEGNDDEADRLAGQIDAAPMEPDLAWQITRRAATAPLLARRGRVAEAESVAREAVALAAASDFLGFQADSHLCLAEVLEVDGRGTQAEAAAAEAARLYERKGNVVAAARAREIAAAVV